MRLRGAQYSGLRGLMDTIAPAWDAPEEAPDRLSPARTQEVWGVAAATNRPELGCAARPAAGMAGHRRLIAVEVGFQIEVLGRLVGRGLAAVFLRPAGHRFAAEGSIMLPRVAPS